MPRGLCARGRLGAAYKLAALGVNPVETREYVFFTVGNVA